MTNTKKITKRDSYEAILSILDNTNMEFENSDMTIDALKDFVKHEVEMLDAKAAAAKKKAEEKRAESDTLRETVFGVLTDEFQTIADITAGVGDPDVSTQMVTARLTQLSKAGRVEKNTVTITSDSGKSKKVSAYRAIEA